MFITVECPGLLNHCWQCADDQGAFRLGAIGHGWQKLLSGGSPALVTFQPSCVVCHINND